MGFLDELKKIARPYDDGEEFDDEFDSDNGAESAPAEGFVPEPEEQPARPARRNPFSALSREESKRADAPVIKEQQPAAKPGTQNAAASAAQVVLVKPERFESAAEIADHLKAGRAVLLNLEQTESDVARRIVDFVSGVAYARDSKVKKIAARTYIIAPDGVSLMGEATEDVETGGFYF